MKTKKEEAMKMGSLVVAAVFSLMTLLAPGVAAEAAEVKVLCAGSRGQKNAHGMDPPCPGERPMKGTADVHAKKLVAQAAAWRLASLLLERPLAQWHSEIEQLSLEASDENFLLARERRDWLPKSFTTGCSVPAARSRRER